VSRVVYFVYSGVVKVFKTSADGKEQILRLARPRDLFHRFTRARRYGEPGHRPGPGPGDIVRYQQSGHGAGDTPLPKVAVNLIRALSTRIRELTGLVEDLSFKNVMGGSPRFCSNTASNARRLPGSPSRRWRPWRHRPRNGGAYAEDPRRDGNHQGWTTTGSLFGTRKPWSRWPVYLVTKVMDIPGTAG